jgi:hypothetical protein
MERRTRRRISVISGAVFVQITHRENYQRATDELELSGDDDLVWHADRALDPKIAAQTMGFGMSSGWFRSDDKGPHNLPRYFNDTTDDPYGARNIVNGDAHIIPSWSAGMSIGNLIAGYHGHFLEALQQSATEPTPDETKVVSINLNIDLPHGVVASITINGGEITEVSS